MNKQGKELGISGLLLVEQPIFEDDRGWFRETFNKRETPGIIALRDWKQTNVSKSQLGVLRGLHIQVGGALYAQGKYVTVISGTVLDVIVDARKSSPTFGKTEIIELSEKNGRQLFIPKGCLHGFLALSKETTFLYQVDNYRYPDKEVTVNPFDPDIAIDWNNWSKENIILSEKDKNGLSWKEFVEKYGNEYV